MSFTKTGALLLSLLLMLLPKEPFAQPVGFLEGRAKSILAEITVRTIEAKPRVKSQGTAIIVGQIGEVLLLATSRHVVEASINAPKGYAIEARLAVVPNVGIKAEIYEASRYERSFQGIALLQVRLPKEHLAVSDAIAFDILGVVSDLKDNDKLFIAGNAAGRGILLDPRPLRKSLPAARAHQGEIRDPIIARPEGGWTVQDGNSGGALFDRCLRLVGLVHAGGGEEAAFSSIDNILNELSPITQRLPLSRRLYRGICSKCNMQHDVYTWSLAFPIAAPVAEVRLSMPAYEPFYREYHARVMSAADADRNRFNGPVGNRLPSPPISSDEALFPSERGNTANGSEGAVFRHFREIRIDLYCYGPQKMRDILDGKHSHPFPSTDLSFKYRLRLVGANKNAVLAYDTGRQSFIVYGSKIEADDYYPSVESITDLVGGSCFILPRAPEGVEESARDGFRSMMLRSNIDIQLRISNRWELPLFRYGRVEVPFEKPFTTTLADLPLCPFAALPIPTVSRDD